MLGEDAMMSKTRLENIVNQEQEVKIETEKKQRKAENEKETVDFHDTLLKLINPMKDFERVPA
jgi:hypothetical protein